MRGILDKRGAIELSIGTVVIIVLAMSMLILGLVLVRNIFSGATESVDILDDKVQGEIINLFSDEGKNVIVKLGSDRTAKVKPNEETVSIGLAARSQDGSNLDRTRLQYELSLDIGGSDNCVNKMGQERTERLFITPLNIFNDFDEFQGSSAFAAIELRVPEGTPTCTQKIVVDVKDTQTGDISAGTFFRIEVLREGLF